MSKVIIFTAKENQDLTGGSELSRKYNEWVEIIDTINKGSPFVLKIISTELVPPTYPDGNLYLLVRYTL